MATLRRNQQRRKNRETKEKSREVRSEKSREVRSEKKSRKVSVNKYNIYIICKNEEIFMTKAKEINSKYKTKICHIQWVPAEYLKLTQCNKKLLNE